MNEVFLLNLEYEKNISNFTSLLGRLIETFDDIGSEKIKIVGKEHLMKR